MDGTTIDEVEKYHRDTLKLVIERTNEREAELVQARQREKERERQQIQEHKDSIKDVAKRLMFD